MILYLGKQDYARLRQSLDSQVCFDEYNMSSVKYVIIVITDA
jgi:hypothetical protein